MIKPINKIIIAATIACTALIPISSKAQTTPSYLDTTGLIGWYPFSSNTNDSSGNNYNGTNNGALLTADRFGKPNSAYSFNGATSYIKATFPKSLKTTSFKGLSISSWFKVKTISGQPQNFTLLIDSAEEKTFAQWYDPSIKKAAVCNGVTGVACANYLTAIDVPDTTKWYHIVLTSNFVSPKTDLYINGVLQASTPNSIIHSDIKHLNIGKHNGTWFMNGDLDDIAIWNRSLSQCEIVKQYLSLGSLISKHPTKDSVLHGSSAIFQISDTGGTATFQWQENSGSGFANIVPASTYSGTTSKTLTIIPVTLTMNNYQYRCVRNGGVCIDTSTPAKLVVYNSTGISRNESSKAVLIFPNPTSNSVEVNAPFVIESLEVVNLLGQVVAVSFPNSINHTIDLKALPSATYIVRINQTVYLRIVKN